MAAERLAGDQSLADRTREAAPGERAVESGVAGSEGDSERDVGVVEAFLDDERKIEAIREQAREEAEERAEEWGFDV